MMEKSLKLTKENFGTLINSLLEKTDRPDNMLKCLKESLGERNLEPIVCRRRNRKLITSAIQ